MIIELFSNLVLSLFGTLFSFNVPMLPSEADAYIHEALGYMVAGGGILANYVPLTYFMSLMGIIVSIELAIGIYRFVMWVLKKIPMASVSD